jgi:hypothetical protein
MTIELLGITYVSRESLQEATGCTPDVFVRAEKVETSCRGSRFQEAVVNLFQRLIRCC